MRRPLLGGVRLRVVAAWRAPWLDRQLAKGVDPMLSDELSLRVGRLAAAGTRVRVASALRMAVQFADGRRAPLIATRFRRAEVRESSELLLALAERIRSREPAGAQGLAMAARLVDDRSSPLYRGGEGRSLAASLMKALAALERGHLTLSTA